VKITNDNIEKSTKRNIKHRVSYCNLSLKSSWSVLKRAVLSGFQISVCKCENHWRNSVYKSKFKVSIRFEFA